MAYEPEELIELPDEVEWEPARNMAGTLTMRPAMTLPADARVLNADQLPPDCVVYPSGPVDRTTVHQLPFHIYSLQGMRRRFMAPPAA